mgnify:CR=1 FL=1
MADRMINRGTFKRSILRLIIEIFFSDRIMAFLRSMRKYSYYKNKKGLSSSILRVYYYLRFRKWSHELGFSIGCDSLGYGVLLPHYGTIVVGRNKIGNYAVLHTSTCITGNDKIIGNALYLGAGAKMTRKVLLGDNVSIGANSLVNNSFPEGNCLLVGAPAIQKKHEVAWYVRDGDIYNDRVKRIEALKIEMGI